MKLQIRPPSEFLCKNIERGAHIWLGPHYPFISVICRMGFLGLWLQLWRIIGTCSTQSQSFGLFLRCTSTNSPDKFHFFFLLLYLVFFSWYIWQVPLLLIRILYCESCFMGRTSSSPQKFCEEKTSPHQLLDLNLDRQLFLEGTGLLLSIALYYIVASTDPFSRLFSAVSKFCHLQTKWRVQKMEK